MKKNDIVLTLSVLFAAAVLFFVFSSKSGAEIKIKENNKTVYSGKLSTDKTIHLKNNTVVIKDGTAVMHDAKCKNQICVNTGKISKSGESIICLPNRVSVTIE